MLVFLLVVGERDFSLMVGPARAAFIDVRQTSRKIRPLHSKKAMLCQLKGAAVNQGGLT
jgi:hypothetical protein